MSSSRSFLTLIADAVPVVSFRIHEKGGPENPGRPMLSSWRECLFHPHRTEIVVGNPNRLKDVAILEKRILFNGIPPHASLAASQQNAAPVQISFADT